MASARISRPSASVLPISTVLPEKLVTMSPGRVERPETMFSTSGITPTMRRLSLSAAAVSRVAVTAAAPAISHFMSPMDGPVLMLRPPESKVTPLPTSTTVSRPLRGLCSSTTMAGLFRLPAPTANRAPNFLRCSSASVNTRAESPLFLAAVVMSRANCSGVFSLEGVLTQSRARMVPRQTVSIWAGSF